MRIKFYTWTLIALFVSFYSVAQVAPRTVREIELLLNEKYSRTSSQQKIDSRLLQFLRETRGQRMTAGVALDAVKIDENSKGNITIDINGEVDDDLMTKIEAMGGKVIFMSIKFQSLRAEIKPGLTETIAALPEVKFVKPAALRRVVDKPMSAAAINKYPKNIPVSQRRINFDMRAKRVQNLIKGILNKSAASAPRFAGAVNSQGDRAHRTLDTRSSYGYAGQGIRIGVISDSYNLLNAAAADVSAGELPGPGNPFGNTTPVTILEENTTQDGGDEGRAMLQIVHDLAPKAQLYFATAYNGPASFASNIIALRNAPYNCDVIIDDIGYSDEPAFFDGIIAQAVNTVTANGALYFSAAGNDGSIAKNQGSAYEADFNDAGSPAFTFTGITKTGTIHNFGTVAAPANGDSIIGPLGAWYTLDWADAPEASVNDYDLFVVSATGAVKASSTNIQNGTQDPREDILSLPSLAAGDRLVVFKTATAARRAFRLYNAGGRMKYVTIGHTYGHATAADAFGVAATPAASAASASTQPGPFPAAFNSSNQVEYFSSDGPRKIFYNPNGTPITPGNFLFATNGGLIRNKPDITAADGVLTTLPAASGLNPFYGTSAAAPHAGAIAALLKSANRALTPAQIRSLLTTTALDIEAPGFDNLSGYGILQAFQAMQQLSPTPQATLNLGTVTTSEGSFKNGNGNIDPGEIGNLTIQLTNPSLTNATNTIGTITTTTPGVTIIQNTASFGTVNGSGSATNASPFIIAFNSSVACGSTINFSLSVAFAGGNSPVVYPFSISIGFMPFAGGIASVLGGVPTAGPGYTVLAGQQSGRVTRTGTGSVCATATVNPGLTATTGSRQYDAYTFTNTNSVSQCVTVTVTSANGINLFVAAYNEAGFLAANPSTNYVASPGLSGPAVSFSFNAPAGKAFTVVIHDVNILPASNSPYRLSLSLATCTAGPACTPTDITTTTIAPGTAGTPYEQEFAATGGSGNYAFSFVGNLPAGLTFTGNKLSGTPTQAGTFPVKIAAADLTGCPADTNTYSLVIAGILPSSLTLVSGTPQTVLPLTIFPDSLKVIVRDVNNNPLAGVNVVFQAPATGAGVTFDGGMKTITVVTGSNGVAAARATATIATGSYLVTATVNGLPAVNFSLANTCPTSFIVTNNADSGAGTLREIINNACAGTVVTFAPGITNITLTSGELVIAKGISILGPGATNLTISGNNLSRIFNIVADTATVTITGMTIRDGKPVGTPDGGGGILIDNGAGAGAVNIFDCVITNNDVTLAANPLGGGIDNEGGRVTIRTTSIINNTASFRGGGIQNQGFGNMFIISSTIAANTAGAGGIGGGIRSFLPLSITNSTIFGNSAQTGGNLSRSGDSITLGNTIVAGGTLIGASGTGPDLSGGAFKSLDYNLFQSVAGSGTIAGITAHNLTGLSPMMLPQGMYGGNTPVYLPQPSSPAVNAGNPAASGTDQRGLPRVAAGVTDIGAVEVNYTVTTTSGTPQIATIFTPFAAALQARVNEYSNLIQGVPIFFNAPVSGASGTFPNLLIRDTVTTNVSGIASRVFRANGIAGTYNDTARIGAAFPVAIWRLTNVNAEGPLPLIFGAITVTAANCTTTINWETLTEINTRDFSVEYSADGLTFAPLVTIPAKGNSTILQKYKYSHELTSDGIYYYRIKQTDLNGAFTYSKVLIATNSCGSQPIVAYPNPVKNILTVNIPGTEKHLLEVFDGVGHKIYQKNVNGGKHQINASGWVQGVYTLSVSKKGEKAYLLKIVKD